MNQVELKCYFAAYGDRPPRTTALEQQIQICTGFHSKWYRSQRERWLGWLTAKDCEARLRGEQPSDIDAAVRWKYLLSRPLMFWVAESAGMATSVLDATEDAAVGATAINSKSGHPHGMMMREVLPWCEVEHAILTGPEPIPQAAAERIALPAFDRLCAKKSEFQKLRTRSRFVA